MSAKEPLNSSRSEFSVSERALRRFNVFTALAMFVAALLFAAVLTAEQITHQSHQQAQRNEVLTSVANLRSSLESDVGKSVELVKGLVAILSSKPDMDQTEFSQLVDAVLNNNNLIRNIAIAPDLVVNLVYPLIGNEAILGVDYNTLPAQLPMVLKARDTGRVQLAGPVNLVQGGLGLIVRFPIFVGTGTEGQEFWGIASAVIEVDALFAHAGLAKYSGLDIALMGRNATGRDGEAFLGDANALQPNPVSLTVNLPNGSWEILAQPRGGWTAHPHWINAFRAFEAIVAILMLAPLLIASGLSNERLLHRSALKSVSRRLELALTASNIGVWEYDLTRDQLYWDARMKALYNLPADRPVVYDDWENALVSADRKSAIKDFDEATTKDLPYRSRFRVRNADGTERHIRALGTVFTNEHGGKTIIGVNWDASEEVQRTEELQTANEIAEARNADLASANARIERIALTDVLTGLPNRRHFEDYLRRLAKANDRPFGVLHLDVDRFKQINDTLGHAAGDELLIKVARTLKDNVAPTDFVARIGGDEFMIICRSHTDQESIEHLAKHLVDQLRQPVSVLNRDVRSSASIGIALSSSAPGNAQQLSINADIALYRAKRAGRNGYEVFTAEMHQEIVHTKRMADDILSGLERHEFIAFFQPQVDAQTRKIVGAEALVRWQHPERGLLAPMEFLDVATDLNVVQHIDAAVLDQALAAVKHWKEIGLGPEVVSVNVSARRLSDPDLFENLNKLPIASGELRFELVESTFLDHQDDIAAHNLDRIRELGIGIEIDDFGTGYASIVSLTKLHPDCLKIDRELIRSVGSDQSANQLVKSIVDIAATLNIDVLAEGVETMEQADLLAELGCSSFQGFGFARPMAADDFVRFTRKWDPVGARKTA